MSVISATRGSYRETADGSLEVKIIIDPRFKDDFHRIFREKDAPIAIAPLVADFERQPNDTEPTTQNVSIDNKLKGGELAKWAGILCKDPLFWQWLETDDDNAAHSENGAIWCIRDICGVESRTQLDHNKIAGEIFRNKIMQPFSEWKESLQLELESLKK